jgi:hypothetical protein
METLEGRIDEIDGVKVKSLLGPAGGAVLSMDEKYRYLLTRPRKGQEKNKRTLGAIGQNPSKADHVVGDLTVTKLVGFADRLGCGRLVLGNLFGYRSTDPDALLRLDDPRGPINTQCLYELIDTSDIVLACWGSMPKPLRLLAANTILLVQGYAARAGKILMCLGKTADGKPCHPSRLGYDKGIKAFCGL